MRRAVSSVLIVIGVLVIIFPSLRVVYFERKQDDILEAWESLTCHLEEDAFHEGSEAQDFWGSIKLEDIDGILEIDRIDLKEPVFKEVTETNLYVGVAKIQTESELGAIGNYAIAGHRNRTYGKHFNRLGELEKGDLIKVSCAEELYTYEVYEVLIVKAEDSWVIQGNGKDSLITLVTCDYSVKPTGRLVVRAKSIEQGH